MGRTIAITASWVIAGLIFWAAFFVAAPWVQSLIPAGDWKQILDVIVYIVVAWLGGIGIPLWVGISGTLLSMSLD